MKTDTDSNYIKRTEISPHIDAQSSSCKDAQTTQWGKASFSDKQHWENHTVIEERSGTLSLQHIQKLIN